MANRRKRSRLVLTVLAAAVIGGALTFAFRAQPMLVDIGAVEVRPMMSTIDEVGRTQVRNPYVVSTPVAGRLQTQFRSLDLSRVTRLTGLSQFLLGLHDLRSGIGLRGPSLGNLDRLVINSLRGLLRRGLQLRDLGRVAGVPRGP